MTLTGSVHRNLEETLGTGYLSSFGKCDDIGGTSWGVDRPTGPPGRCDSGLADYLALSRKRAAVARGRISEADGLVRDRGQFAGCCTTRAVTFIRGDHA